MHRACLALSVAAALLAGGCRSRLVEVIEPPPPPDFSIPPDLVHLPDFTPPPDMAYCREIYTIDGSTSILYGFDTIAGTFTPVGKVNCRPQSAAAKPDTMSIDLEGTAWVFYDDGELFHVSLQNASCTPTAFQAMQTWTGEDMGAPLTQTFGSSFCRDDPGGASERIYLTLGTDRELVTVDPQTLALTRIGTIPSEAELAGTAAAELWGYFPGTQGGTSFIARIDRQTAALDRQIRLPTVPGATSGFAFSFWGGSFWIFNGEGTTVVYQVDPNTGKTIRKPHPGLNIVGAGVSGCAPLGLDN